MTSIRPDAILASNKGSDGELGYPRQVRIEDGASSWNGGLTFAGGGVGAFIGMAVGAGVARHGSLIRQAVALALIPIGAAIGATLLGRGSERRATVESSDAVRGLFAARPDLVNTLEARGVEADRTKQDAWQHLISVHDENDDGRIDIAAEHAAETRDGIFDRHEELRQIDTSARSGINKDGVVTASDWQHYHSGTQVYATFDDADGEKTTMRFPNHVDARRWNSMLEPNEWLPGADYAAGDPKPWEWDAHES